MEHLTKENLEALARLAGREGAKEALVIMGLEVSNPMETQRDFAHLRMWRRISEKIFQTWIVSFCLAIGATLASLIWLGFKTSVIQ